jgi:hypothetical protein
MLKLQGLCQKKSKQIIFYFDKNLILMYAYFVVQIIKQKLQRLIPSQLPDQFSNLILSTPISQQIFTTL